MPRRRLPLPKLNTWRARFTALGGVIALVAIVALAGYLYVKGRTGSVYNKDVPFKKEEQSKPPPKPTPKDPFVWPFYGYGKLHHRYFPAPPSMKPPFRKVWENNESALLEFPPVMSGNRIFQLADDGTIKAINKTTGATLWERDLGALSASTPAIDGGTVFATVLSRTGGEGGAVVALRAKTGAIIWSKDLPSRSESSPIVDHRKVFFGSENGTVYALREGNGSTVWTYQAAGAVKASPTLYNGILYFGDYAGVVQAIGERTGRRIWSVGSEGAPLGSGTFYSTAAIAYGRVYLGNTDGRIYAYEARSGRLAWAVQTGAYVYASPAVADIPGLGPTVFEGSYDGSFYAINARSGAIEWTHPAGGKISGSATVVGNVVYFSDLGTHSTSGLNARTGASVFSIDEGAFDPGISDGHKLYLDGYDTLFALQPRDLAPKPAKSSAKQAKSTPKQAGKTVKASAAKPSQSTAAGRRVKAARSHY